MSTPRTTTNGDVVAICASVVVLSVVVLFIADAAGPAATFAAMRITLFTINVAAAITGLWFLLRK